ncbi:hypothetical protein [Nonomuraea sp. JJY05]|jgi:hypothetical protein|uniref:hypothetical protein n=1 Tax=Nonomuraea sp. JJY05 TaxID=3350255 RepID=UPI00373EB7EC
MPNKCCATTKARKPSSAAIRRSKGPLAVTSLYLKSDRHINALITVICLALLTCLIEHQVRLALAARGQARVDGLYVGRPAVPTGKLVLDALTASG